jgi:hypothetical protein
MPFLGPDDDFTGTSYVNLTMLKANLSITDSADDTTLTQALNSASVAIDDYCGRTFSLATQATERRFRTRRSDYFMVDDIGTLDDLVVTVNDAELVLDTHFETAPDNALDRGRPITAFRAHQAFFWPTYYHGRPSLHVTAHWGWPAVPEPVKQACLIQASRLWRRKDSPEGVTGIADIGIVHMTRIDPDVRGLLERYKLVTLA